MSNTKTTTVTATANGPTTPIAITGSATFSAGAVGLEARYLVPPSVVVPNSNDGFSGDIALQVTVDQPDPSGNWNPVNWAPISPPVSGGNGTGAYFPIPALATGVRGMVSNYNSGTATVQVCQ